MKLNMSNGIGGILTSTVTSGGIISGGSYGYIGKREREKYGFPLAHYLDGQVVYVAKDKEILKRAAIQRSSQLAYGLIRSYPRYLKYYEQKKRKAEIESKSQTSIRNTQGQYYQLIEDQKANHGRVTYKDSIVGNKVIDYLELSVNSESSCFDPDKGAMVRVDPNKYKPFVDLQPIVQVSSKNNVLLTNVQGRDYTRKEYISGGDLEITITGKITSKYPDVYPDGEVTKFLKLMQFKGVLNCVNTILDQFNISQLIILSYSLSPVEGCRNIQPYTLTCVAVEPNESIEIKNREEEEVDKVIADTNGWIKLVRFGVNVIDPAVLLKLNFLWL